MGLFVMALYYVVFLLCDGKIVKKEAIVNPFKVNCNPYMKQRAK